MKKRKADAAAIIFLVLASALVFYVLFLAFGNAITSASDYVLQEYFWRLFYRDALLNRELPFWNPYLACGRPFMAAPQSAFFYPFSLLYLVMPIGGAVTLLTLFHLLVAGISTYCFARTLGMSGKGALVAALVHEFSGFAIITTLGGHSIILFCMAYLPLIFLATEKILQGKYAWASIGAFVLALSLFAGHPQPLWLAMVAASVYFLLKTVFLGREIPLAQKALRAVFFLLMVGLGVLISGCQVLMTLELVSESYVPQDRVAFSSFMSLGPRYLILFLIPDLLGSRYQLYPLFYPYLGMLPLVLMPLSFLSKRKGTQVVFLVLVVFFLLLSLGNHTPFFHFAFHAIPGFSLFRVHARSLLVVGFAVAILSGFGLDELIGANGGRKGLFNPIALFRVLCIVLALIVLSLLLRIALGSAASQEAGAVFSLHPILILLLLLTVSFFMEPLAGRRSLFLLVVLILLSDTCTAALKVKKYHTHVYMGDTLRSALVRKVRSEKELYRFWMSGWIVRYNCPNEDHTFSVTAYTQMPLERYYVFIHRMAGVPIRPWLRATINEEAFTIGNHFPFKILNVKYAARQPKDGPPVLVTNPAPFPRAAVVRGYAVIDNPDTIIDEIRRDSFDPLETVVLEEEPGPPAGDEGASAGEDAAAITSYSRNSITCKVTASEDSFLLLSEMYYPGWKATVDGKPARLYRADYALRAVRLTQGNHTVELRFVPRTFLPGLCVSALGIVTAVVLLLIVRKPGSKAA
jgi:hypothetical protein